MEDDEGRSSSVSCCGWDEGRSGCGGGGVDGDSDSESGDNKSGDE